MANEEILELQIRDNAAAAAGGLDRLATALERIKTSVGKGLRLTGVNNQLEKLMTTINNSLKEESIQKFERLADSLERLKNIGAIKISGIKDVTKQLNVSDSMTDVVQQANNVMGGVTDAVDRGIEEIHQRTGSASDMITEPLEEVNDAVRESKNELAELKAETNDTNVGGFFKALKQETEGFRNKVKGLWNDFKRIIKYRTIRNVIKQITQALKEGTENLYFYSKAMGTDFAKSMDSAASSFLYLKNSIGAALAPALQSLIPILNAIVNGVVVVINFINQLLSLLTGKLTWTKAVRTQANAFEATKKSAKGANKAIKELLADWDELNIIQSESASGSGAIGNAVTDYAKMFEEVELPRWMIEWKPIIEAILAGTLGAIILPKIFDWVSRIFRLFSGNGGSTLMNILNKLFGNDKFPTQPNYKPFPEMPNYGQFPVQPTYSEFPVMPDYSKAATDMGIFSAASVAAAPALESIVGSLTKLKTLFDGLSLLKTIIPMIFGFLGNALGAGNIKIKVDKKEFEDFKKEYDEFKNSLDDGIKIVSLQFEKDSFDYFFQNLLYINQWAKQKLEKIVGIKFEKDSFDYFFKNVLYINTWIDQEQIKNISLKIVDNNSALRSIIDWINKVDTKVIEVKMKPVDPVTNAPVENPVDSAPVANTTTKKNNPWEQPIWNTDWNDLWNYMNNTNFFTAIGDIVESITGPLSRFFNFNMPDEVKTDTSVVTVPLDIQMDKDLLKMQIEEAMEDGVMDSLEKTNLITNFGKKMYEEMLKELQYNLDENGYNRGMNLGKRQLASTGMSDTSYKSSKIKGNDSSDQTGMQIAANMENSMKRANDPQNDLIRQLIRVAESINRKDFTVNVYPSSGWGNFGTRSAAATGRITGALGFFG